MLLLSCFPYNFDVDQFKLTREAMVTLHVFLTQMQFNRDHSQTENLFSPEEVSSCLALAGRNY